ncbi:MAG TPA: S8 family serine peptidase [Chitinophagaceae bacterium]|nr:S8 family serine peptidase [Chitinophagaceae bacterium]
MWKKHAARGKALVGCLIFFSLLQEVAGQVSVFSRYAGQPVSLHSFDPSKPYYITTWKDRIPSTVKIIRRFDDRTAVIQLDSQSDIEQLKNSTHISPANDQWKLSPGAEISTGKYSSSTLDVILTVTDTESLKNILREMTGLFRIMAVDEPSRSFIIKTSAQFLREKLLPLKQVIFADIRIEPHTEIGIIGYNRSFHGLNAVDYAIPGANGKNIVAGVKEQKMEALDLDLYKRVLPSGIAAATTSNHATVISSIIGGAGNSFYDGRGIAYGCAFFPSSFSNLFPDDAAILNAAKVTVQNHSYGTVIQQFYGAEAVSYDVQTWQNKNLLHVFSAGNQGTAVASSGSYANIPGYANLTGNFKMAKNIITVGATDNKGNIPVESSAGPLYDGRIAPQLIALGPNGTSDAAAIVSGTVAVLQQVYADNNGLAIPPASLIKALLYNNADDIYRAGIDYKTGYGLLNSFAAVLALLQHEYDGGSVIQSQQWTRTITIPPNCAQVKLTLAWTDSASLPNNNKALINDLDLELVQLSNGSVYKPWVLSAAAHIDSLSKLPVRKRDSLNTAEQVSIQLPAAGNYEVRVTGSSVPGTVIPFHIAFHTDTLNTFRFTSPQHTSDVNRDENADLDIRWRTFVADTNQTGNLYISYNTGLTWQLIKAGHKIYTNYYQWPIKDTNSRALFKMETGFGDFLSKEFVISKVTRLNVDFLCTDSFRLSWNKHIYAGSYKLFALVDSPYLKPVLNVADSFIVLNRSQYTSLVYAVEPVLTNGLPAARSIALDISFQGVKCFYKTFYYTLFDQNKLDLILELSAPGYVDSLFFEQVSSNGQLIKNHGSIKVNSSSSLYDQFINEVPGGTSYWRVRIKLKSGAVVYSEIVSVLTSGTRYILFYPNPSRRTNSMVYNLKQGVPPDSRLQFFDISGRMLRDFTELPGIIKANSLPAGMLIYKLLTREGQLLETGKLLLLQ